MRPEVQTSGQSLGSSISLSRTAGDDACRTPIHCIRIVACQKDMSRNLHVWCSLAADEAGVFANPAYSPPSPAAETLELPRQAPLARKTSMAALRAAVMARALPVLKSPLEAFQQRRSKSVDVPIPSQETEVSRKQE